VACFGGFLPIRVTFFVISRTDDTSILYTTQRKPMPPIPYMVLYVANTILSMEWGVWLTLDGVQDGRVSLLWCWIGKPMSIDNALIKKKVYRRIHNINNTPSELCQLLTVTIPLVPASS
jgi:hypothetical protein